MIGNEYNIQKIVKRMQKHNACEWIKNKEGKAVKVKPHKRLTTDAIRKIIRDNLADTGLCGTEAEVAAYVEEILPHAMRRYQGTLNKAPDLGSSPEWQKRKAERRRIVEANKLNRRRAAVGSSKADKEWISKTTPL